MLPLGLHKGTILSHGLYEEDNDKQTPYLGILFSVPGMDKAVGIKVYTSDAAASMAYKAIKKCGFDIHKDSILVLQHNKTYLKGNVVDIEFFEDDYKGKPKLKWQIPLGDSILSDEKARHLDEILRAVKKEDDAKPTPAKPNAARVHRPDPNAAAYKQAAEHADDEVDF